MVLNLPLRSLQAWVTWLIMQAQDFTLLWVYYSIRNQLIGQLVDQSIVAHTTQGVSLSGGTFPCS